jgi:hypothetical protein
MSTPITRSGIEELRERIRRLEGAAGRRRLVLPFGIKAIDRHLPGGGLALWSWRSGTACTRTRFMPGRSKFSITSRAFSRAAMAVWRAGMDKIEAAGTLSICRFAWTTHVARIPTAETAKSGLILEGQGQARLHLKSKISWSHEWGPVQLPTHTWRT